MGGVVKDIRMVYVAIGCFFSFLMASCVTNEGDIGPLYGQWSLTSMTVDSEASDIDVRLYFWKFQNDIIQIQKDTGFNRTSYSIGTWERTGDTLYLNFTHSAAPEGSENWATYNPPPELGIPGRVITPLQIEKLSGKDMSLQYTDSDGKIYRYSFRKLI